MYTSLTYTQYFCNMYTSLHCLIFFSLQISHVIRSYCVLMVSKSSHVIIMSAVLARIEFGSICRMSRKHIMFKGKCPTGNWPELTRTTPQLCLVDTEISFENHWYYIHCKTLQPCNWRPSRSACCSPVLYIVRVST